MDNASFDTFTRFVAARTSRRGAVKSTLVSVLAALGVTSLLGADPAESKKKRRKRKRRRKRRQKRKHPNCTPSCGANTCGGDGCGGSCGTCAANETCQHGSCVCEPNCGTNTCGDDGCGGLCGTCEPNEACDEGTCVCVPDCDGSTCGEDGCDGTCACDDQSFCQDETCVPCPFPCAAGHRCVHGTCTCDPFNNGCPFEGPMDQCSCGGQTVDVDGQTCADKFSACDIDTPCTTHDDCPVGSACKTTCVDPDHPLGPNRCSNPCIPA